MGNIRYKAKQVSIENRLLQIKPFNITDLLSLSGGSRPRSTISRSERAYRTAHKKRIKRERVMNKRRCA